MFSKEVEENKRIPELRELLEQWDFMEPKIRGQRAGFIFGKYGIEIALPGATAKVLQKYQAVRRANALCTLEAMASSPENRMALEKLASEALIQRQDFFKNVTIQADKQGKDVVGHRNYNPKAGDPFQPSILTHPDPQKLLQEHAGKGSPTTIFAQGQGYREVVDFKQHIGEYFDEKSQTFLSTTRGTIHYDKNGGAHIVPARPNNP